MTTAELEIVAGFTAAVARWIPPHEQTPELDRFRDRAAGDPGFRQFIDREIIAEPSFRRHRDLIAYRCLKSLIFPAGASFEDDWDATELEYGARQAARIERDARDANILIEYGRAKRDGRAKRWKTPFAAEPEDVADLQQSLEASRALRSTNAITGIMTQSTLLYGPAPFQEFLGNYTDEEFARQFLTGWIRKFELNATKDEIRQANVFRRALTHLKHQPDADKKAWGALDRLSRSTAVEAMLFQGVTAMLVVDWFAKQPPDDQHGLLEKATPLRITANDAAEAYNLRFSGRDSMLDMAIVHGLHALCWYGQTSASLAVAEAAANNPRESALTRGLAYLRHGQLTQDASAADQLGPKFAKAAAHFAEADRPFFEAIARLYQATFALSEADGAAALRRASAILPTFTTPTERFGYHFHLALLAATIDDSAAEMRHLLDALQTDALTPEDSRLYNRIQSKLDILPKRSPQQKIRR